MVDFGTYLPQFVYGATDGIVTTFAIVAGAAGANVSPVVILAIGIASVLADGYSMGISSYLSKQSEDKIPSRTSPSPVNVGVATFLSFVIMGMIPILPFLIPTRLLSFTNEKIVSFVLALLSFFSIGFIKGSVRGKNYPLYSGIQTFLIGLSAAVIAYFTGYYVSG